MTVAGLQALRAERDDAIGLATSLSPEEWSRPSRCAGWRVQDVFSHLANGFRAVADPAALAEGLPGDFEATQAAQVAALGERRPSEVVDDYRSISDAALAILASFQEPPLADRTITIDDVGEIPLHLVANALAFDHFCHLRNDLVAPFGPLDRPSPPNTSVRVGAALEWLRSGLPSMSPGLADVLVAPVAIELHGPAAQRWILAAADGAVVVGDRHGPPAGVARTSATDFIRWGTRRVSWRECEVETLGDLALVHATLDAIHLY